MRTKETALTNFSGTCNCCQSVLLSHSHHLGVCNEMLKSISSGFGGGMASQGKTCGAVTGSYMALGIFSGKIKSNDEEVKAFTKNLIQQFNQKFIKDFKTLECNALLGIDMNDSKQNEAAKNAGVFKTTCSKFVGRAAEITEELIDKNEEKILVIRHYY